MNDLVPLRILSVKLLQKAVCLNINKEGALTDHLDIEKLKKLMFSRTQLTEEEDRHLFHCAECRQNMVQATIDQLPSETPEE